METNPLERFDMAAGLQESSASPFVAELCHAFALLSMCGLVGS